MRKTKEDAQKTKQQLIDAAIMQFSTRGVASTTLTDIADAAGVSRGAVYWHFNSKSEIFNAIWEQQLPLCELIRDRLTLTLNDDPLWVLRERFIVALQYVSREPRQRVLLQILYHKCEFNNEMTSEYDIRKKIGFNYENVRMLLERGISGGILSTELNIDMTLIVFHGFFSGLIKNWLMNDNGFNIDLHASALVDNIMATLNVTRIPSVTYPVAS